MTGWCIRLWEASQIAGYFVGSEEVDGLTRAHGSKDSADAMRFPTEKEARVAASFLTVCGMIRDARVERL
jgi:hypothetical protein